MPAKYDVGIDLYYLIDNEEEMRREIRKGRALASGPMLEGFGYYFNNYKKWIHEDFVSDDLKKLPFQSIKPLSDLEIFHDEEYWKLFFGNEKEAE